MKFNAGFSIGKDVGHNLTVPGSIEGTQLENQPATQTNQTKQLTPNHQIENIRNRPFDWTLRLSSVQYSLSYFSIVDADSDRVDRCRSANFQTFRGCVRRIQERFTWVNHSNTLLRRSFRDRRETKPDFAIFVPFFWHSLHEPSFRPKRYSRSESSHCSVDVEVRFQQPAT